MEPLKPASEEDLDAGEVGVAEREASCPNAAPHTHPYIHLDQNRVLLALRSLRSIQQILAYTSLYDDSNDPDLVSRMSKIVFSQNPMFLIRLFGMFVQKFAPPRPDTVNLAFSCFVWAMCHMDQKSTAATLALLYGKCKKMVISGKSLKRMFKHMYGHSFRAQKNTTVTQTLDQYVLGLASEVVAYARGIADLTTDTFTCPSNHCTEVVCDQCVIPVTTFVRFVCKSQRAILWPVAMIQHYFRRGFFGERFWVGIRDLRPMFEKLRRPSNTSTDKCKDLHDNASDALAVNIFTVSRRLLELHFLYKETDVEILLPASTIPCISLENANASPDSASEEPSDAAAYPDDALGENLLNKTLKSKVTHLKGG